LPLPIGPAQEGEERERASRPAGKVGPTGQNGREGRWRRKIPFSFSKMTFPNTFLNDFQFPFGI
jgi:hypothetical protein